MKKYTIRRLYMEYGICKTCVWNIKSKTENYGVLLGLFSITKEDQKGKLLCFVLGPLIMKFGFKHKN